MKKYTDVDIVAELQKLVDSHVDSLSLIHISIQQKDFDGRIPQPIKEWAKTVDVCPEDVYKRQACAAG